MTGLVAGIGIKAIAGSAISRIGSGIGGFFKWLGSLDAIHVILLALAIFGAWQTFGRWSQHRHAAKVETQLTAATNALAASQANETALANAIADQNAAIADLEAKSAQQQAKAQEAIKSATARANDAAASAQRLRASAAQRPSSAATAVNCEPSAALKAQWP